MDIFVKTKYVQQHPNDKKNDNYTDTINKNT